MFKFIIILTLIPFSVLGQVRVSTLFKMPDSYSKFSQDITSGLEFSLREKVLEKKVLFKSYYHDGTVENIIEKSNQLRKDGVDIVVAGETSQYAMIIAPRFKDRIFITPTASSSHLAEANSAVIRMIHSDSQYAELANFVANKINAKKIGVFWNTSYPNTDLISSLVEKKLKGRFEVTTVKYLNGEDINKELLNPFIISKIDTVMIFSFESDLRKVYSVLKNNSLLPTYIGADGWGRDSFLKKNLLSRASNMDFKGYRAIYWHDSRKDSFFRETVAKMKKDFGNEIDAFHAIGFDVGSLINQTLDESVDLRDFIRTIRNKRFTKMLTSVEVRYTAELLPIKDFYIFKIQNNKIEYWGDYSE